MTSIKVKFRKSSVDNAEGSIYYQVICNRVSRQITSKFHVFPSEWDEINHTVYCVEGVRYDYLKSLKHEIESDLCRFNNIISAYEFNNKKFTSSDIVEEFKQQNDCRSTFGFIKGLIEELMASGKVRTAETYEASLNSLRSFRNNQDVALEQINRDFVSEYESYLRKKKQCKNTISFYMRILRAVYNRAVDQELIPQRNPFRHVFTGNDRTIKRAIPISVIKDVKRLDLSSHPELALTRDLFLFSFYTRGMSFVDMAFLKKSDIKDGYIVYRRHKTDQQLFVKIENCIMSILRKYNNPKSEYLLPIIRDKDCDVRKQYLRAIRMVNYRLQKISLMLKMPNRLTTYVARHSWASAARSKNIPISVISESLGHDSELTTQIYLASIDTATIDQANRRILNSI